MLKFLATLTALASFELASYLTYLVIVSGFVYSSVLSDQNCSSVALEKLLTKLLCLLEVA